MPNRRFVLFVGVMTPAVLAPAVFALIKPRRQIWVLPQSCSSRAR
jgi:hypothetical protein